MRTRSDELRAKNRRVFAVSYLLAALILAAIFVWSPKYRVKPLPTRGTIERASNESARATAPVFVHVIFGPPEIRAPDGTVRQEPEDRVLDVGRVVDVSSQCKDPLLGDGASLSGSIRLAVDGSGKAKRVAVAESSGSACGDEVIGLMAEALLYEWLPSDRFPPPVDLTQPVQVLEVAEPL